MSNNRTLGQAPSSYATTQSGLRLAKAYRKLRQLPENVVEAEIAEDNIIHYMSSLCCWAAVTPIPKYFDDNLQPSTPGSMQCCTTETLIGYIGQHYWGIRAKFPDHIEWKNLGNKDHPQWWTNIRTSFITESTRFQMFDGGEYIFGGNETRPLYRDLGGGNKDDISSQCDLNYVLKNLLKTAKRGDNHMETSLQILLTYDSIGRGGEVKFQDVTDWNWDYLLNVTDTGWSESKTLNAYAMARIPDENPLFDFYFQLGAYAMCEKGLYRSQEQIANNLLNKVFCNLHAIQNNSVTGKITDAIRANLPAGLTEAERRKYSAKSLRQGGITTLSMHKDINVFTANARTGHSTGTSNDSYLDKKNPARGLPAAHALHGRADIHTAVVVPRLNEALGEANEVQALALVAAMFPSVNIPDFEVDGRLRIVLKTAAASMLRHYTKAKKMANNNRVCDMMEKAAVTAAIKDDLYPGISPQELLGVWSKIIAKDYDDRLRIANVASMGTSNQVDLNAVIAQLASDVREMKEDKRALVMELASTKSLISQRDNEINALRNENIELSRRLSLFKTASNNANFTPPPAHRPRNQQEQAHATTPHATTTTTTTTHQSRSSTSSRESSIGTASTECESPSLSVAAAASESREETPFLESGGTSIPPATATLKYGHDAQVASEKRGNVKKGGNKGERVYGMFLALAKKGVITRDDLRKIGKDDIPATIDTRYRQHVINCLEMTEFALQGDGGEGRANITILAEANEETREVVDAAIALKLLV